MTLVVDASAMVEVLGRTPTGRALAPRLTASELVAPELLDVEVAAALRRAVNQERQSASEALDTLRVLRDWPIRRVPHSRLVESSVRWWKNVTAYDAVYLAVAVAYNATVVTVDGPLARAVTAGVVVENVRAG